MKDFERNYYNNLWINNKGQPYIESDFRNKNKIKECS